MWQAETVDATLQRICGASINNAQLLTQACSHASLLKAEASAHERRITSNERLEFLGDLVLDLAIGAVLFQRFPDVDEDFLSMHKARLVSRKSLANIMREHDLLSICRVAKHVQKPLPDSILANVAEGVLGALFQQHGYETAATAAVRLLATPLAEIQHEDTDTTIHTGSRKNSLQHLALSAGETIPTYHTTRTGGPDHAPLFATHVTVRGRTGHGQGTSRKIAETAAAHDLLTQLEHLDSEHLESKGDSE